MASNRQRQGRENFRRGQRAEWLAGIWLLLHGHWPIAWRYRSPVGEIDWVCRHEGGLVFVEVKNRPDLGTAGEAISLHAQHRIARAAQYFMASRPHHKPQNIRFDAVLMVPRRWPHHIKNAWISKG